MVCITKLLHLLFLARSSSANEYWDEAASIWSQDKRHRAMAGGCAPYPFIKLSSSCPMEDVSVNIEKPSDIKKDTPRSFSACLGSIGKEAIASEFTRYICVYIVITLATLIYHCIGIYFFLPLKISYTINTAPSTIYTFNVQDFMLYIRSHATYFINHVAYLKDVADLFKLGLSTVALEAIFDHFEVSRKKRNIFYVIASVIGVISIALTLDPRLIYIFIIYVPAEAFIRLNTRILRILSVLCAITIIIAIGYYIPYIMKGTPITEYFDLNGMDISPYKELLDKFNIDISRVFIYGGVDSNNASSNLIGCRNMMAIMIGEYFLKNSSFDTHKGILLHEIGHGIHFDILYMNILPFIIALGAVYALTRKTTKRSVLETTVTVVGKALLFSLIYTLTRNVIAQACETRADDFARLHESSAYLHKGIVELTKGNNYACYYPLFTPVFDHPSNHHRLSRDGLVVITHRE